MDLERVKALFSDKGFVDQIIGAKDISEVNVILRDNGIEISEDETKAFLKSLADYLDGSNDDELSEADLDGVSGGVVIETAVLAAAAKIAGVSLASFLATYLVTKSVSKALHKFGC